MRQKKTEKREQPKVCKEFYWQSTGGQNTQKTPAEEEKKIMAGPVYCCRNSPVA